MPINKEKVAHSFTASSATYDQHAIVQTALADHLLTMIPQHNFSRILEIGCGTGYLAQQLVQQYNIEQLYLNDISPELCSIAQQRLFNCKNQIRTLSGDIEQLLLPKQLNLIISSSTFQWLENLEKTFLKIHHVLCDNGILIFSIFTKGTMKEIASLTDRGLSYFTEEELQLLVSPYFTIEKIDAITNILYFNTIIALFKHIRCTGVGGIDERGNEPWTRRSMKQFELEYRRQYGSEKGLPVSYMAHCFVCKKKGE